MIRINGVELIESSHLPEIVPYGDNKLVRAALKRWLVDNHMEITQSFFERRHRDERETYEQE